MTPNLLQECHCTGNFTTTLLLRTTRMRAQLVGRVSGVAGLQTNKQTNKFDLKKGSSLTYFFELGL